MRYPLIDFHGNMGNISGDGPAAYRYTNARLAKITEDGLLYGIKKNNVDFIPNYDENDFEPAALPAIFPNLLCNPNIGIGVAISCHWLPHNLREVATAIDEYLEGKEPTIPGPDFPTGGLIINGADIPAILKKGKGSVKVRAKYKIEKNKIIYYEIPYETNTESLIDEIGALAEKNESIIDVHDESNKKGLRIVVECKNENCIQNVISSIFNNTNMQKSISYNQVALVDKQPKELNFKQCIEIYINHNIDCLIKETNFDKGKIEDRLHIIDGLLKALEDIDNIIALIKKSPNSKEAQNSLIKKYAFSEAQAKSIVNMKLGSLASLGKIELQQEKAELNKSLNECLEVLSSKNKQVEVIKRRLHSLVDKYGDARRTEITTISNDNATEENSPVVIEKVVVTISQNGNIKRISVNNFKVQKRGGKGPKNKEEIALTSLSINTNEYLLIFTSKGKMYKIFVNDIPEDQKGIMIQNLIALEDDEKIMAVTKQEKSKKYVVFITKNGYLKKTVFEEYSNLKRNSGIIAIKLNPNDTITNVLFMDDEEIMLVTKNGNGIRFETRDINPIGRNTLGIIAIKLESNDEVISAFAIDDSKNEYLITVTENGYGKKTKINDFYTQGRKGKGVSVYKESSASGKLVSALIAKDEDSILLSGTNNLRISVKDISEQSRLSTGSIVANAHINSIIKI